MRPPRVVITGYGLRIPGANTLPDLVSLYRGGQAATAPLEGALSAWAGGRVDDPSLDALRDKQRDLCSVLALAAAGDAITMAGLQPGPALQTAGVYVGCGGGGLSSIEDSVLDLHIKNEVKSPTLVRSMTNAPCAQISIAYGCQGPSLTYAMACSSASHAVGEAMTLIRSGRCERVIAGGVEAPLTLTMLRIWAAMRLLAPGTDARVRPFCFERGGLLLGEGSVFFVLESEAAALARGAEPLAELTGYGARSDASHMTAPNADLQAQTIGQAVAGAELTPQDIGHVSAHGTATLAGDVSETRAIKTIFGSHASALPISATKSFHGHLLGAAGGVSLLASLLAVRTGFVAPTVNFGTPDPELDIDYVPNTAREGLDIRHSLCNAFGFGGSNASLILSRIG
ncbi:beta-ketoacyl-[acyl-carrier-protein] synthase family protein [Asticcacaulis sp. 201]|uniref:beta-ketoacyl-[acyl-carrier-protein] synthase family protein n=1 Tax=Asticcacaulis sp. 201 TaxID=3028787 RepID=UPI002915F216|nr:beta-ketoacyl-[acyl-carrier-protein] synthase family protein [Asticcacaulis sp. 201]MDV6330718.1 beta-ketoacyl-[acyl-carrier-protein] synthase family protein [Asticcacaulis sp. 201]